MKIKDSTRLWYGQYAFKAVFHDRANTRLKQWLKNQSWACKVRRYRNCHTVMVFISSEIELNELILAFAQDLLEQHRPVSQAVSDYIQANTNVEIRKQLLYKKFRHKVYFRYEWLARGSTALSNFVKNHLASRDDYVEDRDWAANYSSYQPVLYLAHDSDLMMLKMINDPVCISKITTIKLISEV